MSSQDNVQHESEDNAYPQSLKSLMQKASTPMNEAKLKELVSRIGSGWNSVTRTTQDSPKPIITRPNPQNEIRPKPNRVVSFLLVASLCVVVSAVAAVFSNSKNPFDAITAIKSLDTIIATVTPVNVRKGGNSEIVYTGAKYEINANGKTRARFAWLIVIDDQNARLVKQVERQGCSFLVKETVDFHCNDCFETIMVITTDSDISLLQGKQWLSAKSLDDLQDPQIENSEKFILEALSDAGVGRIKGSVVKRFWCVEE